MSGGRNQSAGISQQSCLANRARGDASLCKKELATKVLLAEDSAVYRHLISGHLKDWGFDLQIAKDGASAWKLLPAPDAPRLVLLDRVLPQMEGIELCTANLSESLVCRDHVSQRDHPRHLEHGY
jgi:PleD family two-component response regulator